MKRTTKIAATVAVLGVAGIVGAQAVAGWAGPGHGMMMGGPMMHGGYGPMMHGGYGPMMMGGATDPAWFATLKQKLVITPAQEKAWTAYVDAVQTNAQSMQDTHNGMDFQALRQMSPDDLRGFMQGMHASRLDQMTAVATARDDLFKLLDDNQKRLATATLGNFGPGTMLAYGGPHCFDAAGTAPAPTPETR
jgi:hypothetical protein